DSLASVADGIAASFPRLSSDAPAVLNALYRDRFPDLEVLLHYSGREFRYPSSNQLHAPSGPGPVQGILRRGQDLSFLCYRTTEKGDVTVSAPLTPELLDGLMPSLGRIVVNYAVAGGSLPPVQNQFDREVLWFARDPVPFFFQNPQGGLTKFVGVIGVQ